MSEFSEFTNAILSAFTSTTKEHDVINKKREILDNVYEFYNLVPSTVLFVGFNPAIMASSSKKVYVTCISDAARSYLDARKVAYEYIDSATLHNYHKAFDVVVALDEYFTFAATDADQQNTVRAICALAKEFVISTLRDYKNQDFREREFSVPAVVRSAHSNQVYNEFHDWGVTSKITWQSSVFEVSMPDNTLTTYGTFSRHTMYFKQLAKFGMDSGASDFTVHKNVMYKSMIRKNYEYVVSIRFDTI